MGTSWHSIELNRLLDKLDIDPEQGVTVDRVEDRRSKYGKNTLQKKRTQSRVLLFLLQFHQPLVYILLIASFITAFLDEWTDSFVIFGVLFINAVIGYTQELKAIKAIDALANMSVVNSMVIRDGEKLLLDSKEIVVGDIVILNSGDKVPADIRILSLKELQVDESSLTGESLSIEKNDELLDEETSLSDRKNMLYSSSLVTYGHCVGIVVSVGDTTQIGHINEMIANADILQTPLTIKIDKFSHILLYIILGMSTLTFLVGLLRGGSIVEMFMASVALAVGAIPEGLPAAMTIILAIGVSKMAEKKAIVRKLPAVETLGSTSIICSDKTGTLTQNEMTVKQIYLNDKFYTVSGIGYEPKGEITNPNEEEVSISTQDDLKELLIAGVMCNTSILVKDGERYKINGDPTEGALIVSASKVGIHKDDLNEGLIHIDTLYFESQHQYMASHYHKVYEKIFATYIKGSVEKILQRCSRILGEEGSIQEIDKNEILAAADKMASDGMRVLAFARLDTDESLEKIEHAHLDNGLLFLGLQAMIDPPRPEVIESIRSCYKAGIDVKMITGDYAITALTIAKQIGIKTESKIKSLNGRELEKLDDDSLAKLVPEVNVYARVAPEQKLRLVKALQSHSSIVAMTGDGVNDAPALKQANIGTAMGITGTEVAKESADMILLDDNFATIKEAVEEGRGVFDNIVKFITWTLPTNIGEGLVIMFAVFAGTALPILPVQILWINMTTAVLLGLMLAFEPKEKNLMSYPPRKKSTPILTRALLFRVILVGVLLLIGAFGIFSHLMELGFSESVARTAAVNMFVFGELFYLFNCRSIRYSMFEIGLSTNKYLVYGVAGMILLQVFFTYTAFMNKIFKSAPLGLYEWSLILSMSLIIYLVVEMEKKYRRSCET
ncbi:MAG: cation-transporting P-type ATPase [Campylobacterota bacterium]|nr:cation-transporting P-type ATPase [Campylobacterota bacterium]